LKLTFKDKFIELLDDEDIIKKLNKVLKQKNKTPDNSEVMSAEHQRQLNIAMQENKRLENENISLKSQLDKITAENDRLENQINEKQRDITNLKSYNHDILEKYNSNKKELDELESELSETKAELKKAKTVSDKLKGYFKEPFELYDRYKNLDDRIKRQISNIISDKSIMAFISSCSQYGNLEMLWDHTKYLLLNGEDISVLRDIFGYFFELLNESAEKPPYAWSEDNTGIRYDDSRHICGYNSSAQGIVREIQLRGYVSANTGKIVRKTVVKAER